MKFHGVVRVASIAAFVAGLVSCSSNNPSNPPVDNTVAPSNLSYAQADIVATVGTAIAPDVPTVTGTVAS